MRRFSVVFIALCFAVVAQSQYRKTCYFTNWAQYRPDPWKHFVENINASLCTHVTYAFAWMENNILTFREWNDEDMYGRLQALRTKNPNIKLLLAVAGWTFPLERMTAMLKTSSTRRQFIDSVVVFLNKHKFDGFDLDFEWPGREASPATDRVLFTYFVIELRLAFNANFRELLLTIAVPAVPSSLDTGFEIKTISEIVDYITIMSYDYHGGWESVTGHNSPLYPPSHINGDLNNIDATINYMERKGVPLKSINMGIPAYGRGFVLSNPADYGVGYPAKGPSPAGTFTKENGIYSYYEILDILKDPSTKVYKPCDIKAPFLVNGDLWVGYDDVSSIENKVEYAKKKGLGGLSLWSLDQDDFKGMHGTPYPILSAMNKIDSTFRNTFACAKNQRNQHQNLISEN